MLHIVLISFFIFYSNISFAIEYFSSLLRSNPRATMIVYKDEVVLQHLLNKRYVYTIPNDGQYLLNNGVYLYIQNGKIIQKKSVYNNKKLNLGLLYGAFFNQENDECNLLKFMIAKNMLAKDCGFNFHQYQIIPKYPDFIRIIVAQKSDIFDSEKRCTIIKGSTEELMDIEIKTTEAILQERQLSDKKGEEALNSEEEDALKKSKKVQRKLKPWEFGINDRSVIMGESINTSSISGDLIMYYINYFNDIGCIPFHKIKLASKDEFIKYETLFMDGFAIVSEYNPELDKNEKIILENINGNVLKYNPEMVYQWSENMDKYKLEKVNLNNTN